MNCGAQLQIGVKREATEMERINPYNPQGNYAAPPMQPYQAPPMRPGYGQAPVPPQASNAAEDGTEEETKEYDPSGRRFAIILSVAALVMTIVALFALPLDFNSFDTTLFRIGLMDGETTVMALTIIALVIALVALIMPMFTVISGLLVVIAAFLAYGDVDLLSLVSAPGCAVFLLLVVYIISLGLVATVFMKKFIENNQGGVPLFRACYLAWTGIPHN